MILDGSWSLEPFVARGVAETLKSWSPILALRPFREVLSFGWCYNAAFWGVALAIVSP